MSNFDENIRVDGCVLANTYEHFTICKEEKKEKDEKYQYFDISSKFEIAFLKDDLQKFQDKYLISPFLLIYYLFLKKNDEKALYILNQKEFITLAVFKEGSLIFGKHIKKNENFEFDKFIIDSISKFYEGECCFFLERIYLYDANNLKDEQIEKLYESVLIEIDVEKIDIKEILKRVCEDQDILKYAYQKIQKEKFVFPKWLQFSAVAIFLILIIFDLYVRYQNSLLQERVLNLQKEKIELQDSIKELKEKTKRLKIILPLAQEIKGQNSLIVSNIKSVFDLVPDPIVLSKAEFSKNSLILEGFTPNKKVFEQFLNKALKNFYQKVDVKFKRVKGGYFFRSINQDVIKDKNESKK